MNEKLIKEQIMAEYKKIAPLFEGWQEALIWSCLQGCMGYAVTDSEENPSSAEIVVGDFCFFAGAPNRELATKAAAPIMVPRTEAWGKTLEDVWGDGAEKAMRYAIKKEPDVFSSEALRKYTSALPEGFTLKLFDEQIYKAALCEGWSSDFCSLFADYEDYKQRGLGVAVLYEGKLVAGASSYAVYLGGIEIEIDTKPQFRQRGLATACGARLILECLARGLYPSWDAHDLRSVSLAEKLGYHMDCPYPVYIKKQ